jgi:hypothetical protein
MFQKGLILPVLEQSAAEEVVELHDFTLIINGTPSPEACGNFVKLIQQMKTSQSQKDRK